MYRIRLRLTEVRIGEPQTHRRLTLFPLFARDANTLQYITLDDALREACIEVTEVDSEGSMPELKAANRGAHPVLIVEGEELVGAKQNRVANASVMVPPGCEMLVPVTCTEEGRWSRRTRCFASGSSTPLSVRATVHCTVAAAVRATGSYRSGQGAVWAAIQRKLRATAVSSSTLSVHEIYHEYEEQLEGYRARLVLPEGASGVAVGIGGELRCVDLFDGPGALRRLHAKLLRSYAVDALHAGERSGPTANRQCVAALLAQAWSARWTWRKSPGMGEDWRMATSDASGAGLVIGKCPIHIAVFVRA